MWRDWRSKYYNSVVTEVPKLLLLFLKTRPVMVVVTIESFLYPIKIESTEPVGVLFSRDIIELKNQLNNKNVEVKSKDRLLSEKETTNQRLRDEVENLHADLKNSKKEAKK